MAHTRGLNQCRQTATAMSSFQTASKWRMWESSCSSAHKSVCVSAFPTLSGRRMTGRKTP